ncbi:unnamed protein product [Linum trigynum]|uniref:Uncharacterized protein n=1 Tax=Linum trigynum TaxID=586398 RepID=A0AAV2G571_9ROSI
MVFPIGCDPDLPPWVNGEHDQSRWSSSSLQKQCPEEQGAAAVKNKDEHSQIIDIYIRTKRWRSNLSRRASPERRRFPWSVRNEDKRDDGI